MLGRTMAGGRRGGSRQAGPIVSVNLQSNLAGAGGVITFTLSLELLNEKAVGWPQAPEFGSLRIERGVLLQSESGQGLRGSTVPKAPCSLQGTSKGA